MHDTRFTLRRLQRTDNSAIASIIRSVMPEFGADGPGFAIHDTEVDDMATAYALSGCAYFVVELNGRVCGGSGIAPLDGNPGTCELRKMYFLPELRGRGAGTALIRQCLASARDLGYHRCYIETLTGMDAAQRLYEKHEFSRIQAPLGNTGHFGCNRFYLREL
ncbi:MAG TPA: GNAT family N-acetyltransferase [Rudaea sp.]|nr:GNAT family N-acetyltransferase [Rudaea sp.]